MCPTRNCPPWSEIGLLAAEDMSELSPGLVMQQWLNDVFNLALANRILRPRVQLAWHCSLAEGWE